VGLEVRRTDLYTGIHKSGAWKSSRSSEQRSKSTQTLFAVGNNTELILSIEGI